MQRKSLGLSINCCCCFRINRNRKCSVFIVIFLESAFLATKWIIVKKVVVAVSKSIEIENAASLLSFSWNLLS